MAGGARKFAFLLDWQAEPTYLGIYYAKSVGAFAKLGLDVDIIQSWGANQAVQAVAAGKYDIATASGGATVLGHNSGADVISLAVLYPRIPTVVYGLATTPIRAPKDLQGKRVGIYPGSITKNEFDAFVRANGLDTTKIRVISLSGPDIPLLLSKQIDAVLHYTEMSPVAVELMQNVPMAGHQRTFELHLADLGVGGYGLNVISTREALAREPALLHGVVNAVVEGYERGCVSRPEAVAAFLHTFPDKDSAYVAESWDRVCALIGTPVGAQDSIGWERTIAVYRDLGLLSRPLTAKELLP